MEIIYETERCGVDVLRLFRSDAVPRKNALRIHYHTSIELSLILSGTGVYKTAGRTYPIDVGDMFFYRPNEAHCITDIAEDGMSLLNLHISPYYVYTAFPGVTHSQYAAMLSSAFPLPSNRIAELVGCDKMRDMQTLFYKIENELVGGQSDSLLLATNYMSEIFISVFRSLPDKAFAPTPLPYEKTANAIAYIDRGFREEITLDGIAAAAGYSRSYLSTVFKRCMGMSVWDYVSVKRIEAAISEIRGSDRSLLEVATRCGFNNAVQFGKTFRKYTGQTPGAFRRGVTEKDL